MDEQKITQKRNVGPRPVEAEPNHDREKGFRPSNPPEQVQKEMRELPEVTTRDKTTRGMGDAADEVKKHLDR